MRIVFMGTPQFAIPALEKLIDSEHEIVAVFTQPDKPAGRKKKLTPSPVKLLAQNQGIEVFQPVTLKDEAEAEILATLKPDVIVVVAFGQILPQAVLDIPEFGCLNIHPSLLPKYRGASPVASAILAGDEQTGVTVMLLDSGTDTGPILAQRSVPINPEDTTESLESRLAKLGADLLLENLSAWFENRLEPQPQDESHVVCTQQIQKRDGKLDWQLSSEELFRRTRAYYPWPGCYARWGPKSLKVIEAVPLPAEGQDEPGVVVRLTHQTMTPLGVVTAKGILGLVRVQLEGKRATTGDEFLRGQRDFIGQKLS